MAVERPRRTFAIERSLQRQALAEGLSLPPPVVSGGGGSSQGEGQGSLEAQILMEIRALRQDVAKMRKETAGASTPPMDADDTQLLRIEIARMIRSLARAKREIAEIKHPMADDDRVQRATSELDAIVGATEKATHSILDSAERINDCATKMLQITGEDDELAPYAHRISNEIFTIIEACNFQDITGQRIHRVVTTLEFIEARIKKIIEDWGVDAFADLPIPINDVGIHSSDDLVDGPQLENEALSQADIDALFG